MVQEVTKKVVEKLNQEGIEIEFEAPLLINSWFKIIFAKGEKIVDSPEVKKRFDEAEYAIKIKTLKKEQPIINKNQSEAVT